MEGKVFYTWHIKFAVFAAVTKGIGTSISYEKDGMPAETFDTPDAENIIELNGMKSELRICTFLLTILLAATIEEVGWRGYGEDSVVSCFSCLSGAN